MKYLMLIYGNKNIWNSAVPAGLAALIKEVDAFNEGLRESGELVALEGLVPRARSVRMGADAPVVTDGPYLEAKEYVGSYFVVDVDSDERALEIARSYPAVRHGGGAGGGIEVWPLMKRGGSDL